MTREEAIMTQTRDLIKKMADFFTGEEFYEKGEDARLELSPDDVRCMNEVIKACGNAISRQAVHEAITRWAGSMSVLIALPTREVRPLLDSIHELPPVTPKQRTGHWIMSDDGLYRPICNNCGAHPWKGYIPTVEEATKVFEYCPKCGAKMVEPQESEEQA